MEEIKNRIVVLLGAFILSVVGRDSFYKLAQSKIGLAGKIASAFCQGHAGRVGMNYSIYASERDNTRITDIALKYYSDDSLHGFGDMDYETRSDGKPLLEQQRGLIIPLVEKAIEQDSPDSVLEIGAGNGDVLVYLANKYPDIEFTGVDLSVANAESKHRRKNLTFIKGYALDLLNEGLQADIVFSTSTFCIFAPLELESYLDAMKQVKHIIISDPVTFGHRHTQDKTPFSRHMDIYMWFHNYYGHLISRGWEVTQKTVPFSFSHNPNAEVILVEARARILLPRISPEHLSPRLPTVKAGTV